MSVGWSLIWLLNQGKVGVGLAMMLKRIPCGFSGAGISLGADGGLLRLGIEAEDLDVVWRQAGVVSVDHGDAGGFEMAGQGLRVEEQSGKAALL
jgi:hypothetical protein